MGAQTVVGFDTRFLSDRYAVEVARVLAGNNLIVHLANADAPTPAVSLLIIDRICRAYNLPLHETPFGFNHIADLMMKDDVLVGGEESGGIRIREHIPEGDGVLMGLLLLEIVAHAGMPLKETITDLQQQYGPHHYARKDLPLARPVAKKEMVKQLTEGASRSIGGVNVREVRSSDGVKDLLDDDSWLLIRPSGTEPVLRV
jgi:phosphomannomutase